MGSIKAVESKEANGRTHINRAGPMGNFLIYKNALIRLGKANFSESYSSWLHLKVLRLYIESILRYGLPPDFQAFYVKSKAGSDYKLGPLLNKHFQNMENTKANHQIEEDYQQLMGEYCAVVYYSLNTFE